MEQFEEGYDIMKNFRVKYGQIREKIFLLHDYYKYQKMIDNLRITKNLLENINIGFLWFEF